VETAVLIEFTRSLLDYFTIISGTVSEGVILRDELTKRAFWRLGIVTELITGNDNITRAVIVKIVNSDRTQFLRQSIKYIIPVDITEDSSVKATKE